MGAVEKWRKALDAFPAYLAHLVLLTVALLWVWNPGGTAGSGDAGAVLTVCLPCGSFHYCMQCLAQVSAGCFPFLLACSSWPDVDCFSPGSNLSCLFYSFVNKSSCMWFIHSVPRFQHTCLLPS